MIQEICAGIVPIQFQNELAQDRFKGARVYLVQLRSGNHYSFPKGHFEEGEEAYEAAKRELYEETNLQVKSLLLEDPFEENYQFKQRDREIVKKVILFVAEVTGTPRIDPVEVLDGGWFELKDVERQLTYPSSKKTYLEVLTALRAKYHLHS